MKYRLKNRSNNLLQTLKALKEPQGFVVIGILFMALFTQQSCTPQRKVVYLQQPASGATINTIPPYEVKITAGDILSVQVYMENPDAFPGLNTSQQNTLTDNRSGYEKGYTVDVNGMIDLPLIGKVDVNNKTIGNAKQAIVAAYSKYMTNPIVVLKKLSFKVTILGEVNKPGLYYVPNEKLTFLEALGLAGDLNQYADRKEIKLIRQQDGANKEMVIDLTTQQPLQPDYFYVYPDDVIYVKPIKRKGLANINPGVAVITSIITTAAVVTSIILTNSK